MQLPWCCPIAIIAALAGCTTANQNNATLGGTAGAVIGGAATGSLKGAGAGVLLGRVAQNSQYCYYRGPKGRRYTTKCR